MSHRGALHTEAGADRALPTAGGAALSRFDRTIEAPIEGRFALHAIRDRGEGAIASGVPSPEARPFPGPWDHTRPHRADAVPTSARGPARPSTIRVHSGGRSPDGRSVPSRSDHGAEPSFARWFQGWKAGIADTSPDRRVGPRRPERTAKDGEGEPNDRLLILWRYLHDEAPRYAVVYQRLCDRDADRIAPDLSRAADAVAHGTFME